MSADLRIWTDSKFRCCVAAIDIIINIALCTTYSNTSLTLALGAVSNFSSSSGSMTEDEGTGKGMLVKADGIADTFREEVKASLPSNFSPFSRKPKLVGILSTSSAPSRNYAMFTKKQCEEFGIDFVLRRTGAAEREGLGEGDGVEDAIIEANEDDSVDGIMAS